jgi:hypothetical protein
LSAYGEWTKKSGYYRLSGGVLTPLLYEDASISLSTVADKADRLLMELAARGLDSMLSDEIN